MNQQTQITAAPRLEDSVEPLDVLIVGAGMSGIASACHLKRERPDDRFLIVDEQESFGGTWHTHKYPGIRSDSDLYTFGFSFKPWIGKPIATADQILTYLDQTLEEYALAEQMHFGWRVQTADWSSTDKLWTVALHHGASDETRTLKTRFLWMCQGYYRHDKGFTPDWPGLEDFAGEVIHPQSWPEDFDGAGKHMTVIGSGATAATLVPNVADQVDHVTMLQRSPTYFISLPNAHQTADWLRRLDIPEEWVHEIVRRDTLMQNRDFQKRCFTEPEAVRTELIEAIRDEIGDIVDVDKHFTPSYLPWRQRVARIPDGDMFKVIKAGKASIVTDHIDRFVRDGIKLRSGDVLKTDVVVTATGFELCAFGDVSFFINGEPLDFHDTLGYRSMMFTGVPNLVWVMGYFRASWTLRAEMIARFVTNLLDHMEAHQKTSVVPVLRQDQAEMPVHDWADEDDFNPGYLLRGQHLLPKRGEGDEWKLQQDYWVEKEEFAAIDLQDEVFHYE